MEGNSLINSEYRDEFLSSMYLSALIYVHMLCSYKLTRIFLLPLPDLVSSPTNLSPGGKIRLVLLVRVTMNSEK